MPYRVRILASISTLILPEAQCICTS